MKKKLLKLSAIMLVIILLGSIISIIVNKKKDDKNDEFNISVVTSFYPTYIIALNLADNIPELSIASLTDFTVGCLHDYQLTTSDMRLLSHANLFVMNGGGMESYLEDVIKNYPDLPLSDLSEGITMLKSNLDHLSHEDDHEEGDHDHEGGHSHGEFNPHVWLDPVLYIEQIENMEQGLIDYVQTRDHFSAEQKNTINSQIAINAKTYIEKVKVVEDELENLLGELSEGVKNTEIVIFHESFAYLANRIGLDVAYTVELDDDTQLSAGEIAHVIDTVKGRDIKYLFSEAQYKDNITNRIEEETGATTYMIDSAVTGDGTKESYLDAMSKNIELLRAAFQR